MYALLERLHQIGCRISEIGADIAGHPLAQMGLLVGCILWFQIGRPVEILMAGVLLLAITLTPMVLSHRLSQSALSTSKPLGGRQVAS